VFDFADLAVAEGREHADRVIDAIGPETYSYRELVRELARIIGVRRPIVSVPAPLGYAAGWLLGKMLGDVLITRDEIDGLMQGLLFTASHPTGRIRLSTWAREHATTLGTRYATELGRRRGRRVAYVAAT
jgi:NADH dehydrogenase